MGYNWQKLKMKKFLIVSMMLLISVVSFAQIQLLHRFSRIVTCKFPEVSIPANHDYSQYNNVYLYTEYTDNSYLEGVTYCYNADFTLNQEETFSYQFILSSVPSELQSQGYEYYDYRRLSNNIINTDNDVEYFVEVRKGSSYNYTYYGYIINSQGQILGNIGYSYDYFTITYHNVNGQVRMCVKKYNYFDENSTNKSFFTEIYSCGGICTQIIENQNNKIAPEAYPNPAREIINIPYELNEGEISTIRIYDINGKMIEQKSVGYHFNSIELNISNYKSGTYIYECNGNSGKFIVQ
jgi:hypothetical protein